MYYTNQCHLPFTGTGKTATFSISILQQIDTSIKECQALILAPTRELAQQVSAIRNILIQKYIIFNIEKMLNFNNVIYIFT